MNSPAFLTLLPCHHHRFCQGHINPTQPNQGSLCPDCLAKSKGRHEHLLAADTVDSVRYEQLAANDGLSAQANNKSETLLLLSARFLYRYPVRVYFVHATAHVQCSDFPEVQAAGVSVGQAMAQLLDRLKSTLTLYVKQGRKIPDARAST
ncbi:hypothetical protein [Pseudomonas zeae]|uniref:hypothetical protein n=1 Tax=Pseudomonas zeae TaxID=2745510 RepID=UPI0039E19D8F